MKLLENPTECSGSLIIFLVYRIYAKLHSVFCIHFFIKFTK